MAQRRKRAVEANSSWTTFKGKFFHDFDEEGFVCHQGRILDLIGNEIAIVQYFEWVVGTPSTIRVVWVKDIVDGGWALYSSDEYMRDAYEHFLVRRRPEGKM